MFIVAEDGDAGSRFAPDGLGGWRAHLLASILTVFVFTLDCFLPDGVSANSLYSLVILVSVYCTQVRAPFGWAALTTLASVGASLVAPSSIGPLMETLDRTLTIVQLWIEALVIYFLRRAWERAERERGRAVEALEAKGRFLSSASHDLRQPLQSLVLFADVLREQLQGHGASRIAQTMAAAIEALRKLLDNVLDVSKLDAGAVRVNRQSFAVEDLLRRLGDEYALRAEAQGTAIKVSSSRSWATSDPVLVERVLRNLLENALTHAGARKVLMGCRRRGNQVRVEVLDAGRGITVEQMPHIFEEFYQADNPQRSRSMGHGLGLPIVRRITDLLGHRLDVRSTPGRGTTFRLWLPAAESTATAADGAVVQPDRPAPDTRVLVVEDDPLVLPAVKLALEALGCEVAVAQSGSDAVAVARMHPPALVISDFRLPGANGIETISAIRSALGSDVPASLLTGDFSPAIESQSRRLGMGLLRKPVSQEDLAKLVATVRGGNWT